MLPNKDLIIYYIMFAVVKILSTDCLIEFQNNEKLLKFGTVEKVTT
jgi:hypothetical protein